MEVEEACKPDCPGIPDKESERNVWKPVVWYLYGASLLVSNAGIRYNRGGPYRSTGYYQGAMGLLRVVTRKTVCRPAALWMPNTAIWTVGSKTSNIARRQAHLP